VTQDDDVLAEARSDHRGLMLDIAYRMLGNFGDAEDVVQEAFGKLRHHSGTPIADQRAWLVVVVSRLCLDQLRSARIRRAAYVGPWLPEPLVELTDGGRADPLDLITLDESVRMAFLIVLERMSPAERVAFVLHDVFAFSFEEIATAVDRSAAACRQLASRARRWIEKDDAAQRFPADPDELRRVNTAFIAACATGDREALVPLLDPSVAGWADVGGASRAVREPTVGIDSVAEGSIRQFRPESGIALDACLVNGEPGIIALRNGQAFAVLVLTVRQGLITRLNAQAAPSKLARVQLAVSVARGER
jgi:RNA polymerase sigma-70 factor (ECF subfamily)